MLALQYMRCVCVKKGVCVGVCVGECGCMCGDIINGAVMTPALSLRAELRQRCVIFVCSFNQFLFYFEALEMSAMRLSCK